MSSRMLSTAIRASQRRPRPSRLALFGSYRTFVAANPALVTATTSIRKTNSENGPNVSAYSPPKHLGVPSGLTPEQARSRQWTMANHRLKVSPSVSMIGLPMPSLFSSRLRITIGMSQALTSEASTLR
jgi:hypothetical protein